MSYDFTNLRPIRTEDEYTAVTAEIHRIIDAGVRKGTKEGDRLEVLSLLVGAYEDLHYRMDDVRLSPQEVVLAVLEQRGLTRSDLVPILGGRDAVSRFFSGERALSIGQIRKLRTALKISADALIPDEVSA